MKAETAVGNLLMHEISTKPCSLGKHMAVGYMKSSPISLCLR